MYKRQSFMSAYGISHLPKKTGDKLYTLFVVGQIIPFHAVMIAISMLSTKLGLTKMCIRDRCDIPGILFIDLPFHVCYRWSDQQYSDQTWNLIYRL